MRRSIVLAAAMKAATSVMVATAAPAADWADGQSGAKDQAYAASRAICVGLKGVTVPPGDAPTAAEASKLADCSSEALYFGIGRPADPKAARLCAFVEKKAADPQVEDFGFTGDRTLMMVYANGLGADRNLDVATALACRTGFAPAEIDARVKHLARLEAERWTGNDFSLCDDIASGLMMGVCADHDQLVARAERARARAALVAGWTPEQRAELVPLDRAAAAFADARGEHEIDQSGSGRGAFVVGAEEKQDKDFAGLLADVAAARLAPAHAAEADAALNVKYQTVMREAPKLFGGTTVTAAGVASTERAWLRYRDAWLTFAKRRYPALSADALAARLTRERTAQLGGLLAGMD